MVKVVLGDITKGIYGSSERYKAVVWEWKEIVAAVDAACCTQQNMYIRARSSSPICVLECALHILI